MSGSAQFARTPEPPYYAVVFTSRRSGVDSGYSEMAARMVELASSEPGFLGIESASDGDSGITVSYWADLESISRWKSNLEHREAQARGQSSWYQEYVVRIARVERAYGWEADA